MTLQKPSQSTLPSCPSYPEESWRRTDPTQYFLPDEEVLSIYGEPVLPSKGSLQPWKVNLRTASEAELGNRLTSLTDTLKQNVTETLGEDTLTRLIFIDVRHGQAEVFANNALQACLEVVSEPYEAKPTAPGSAIGEAIAQRLKASSPHQLTLKVSSKGDLRPLLVVAAHAAPDYSQTYAKTKLVVAKNCEADVVYIDGGAAFGIHNHEIVVEDNAHANQTWIHIGTENQKDGHMLLERTVTLKTNAQFKDSLLFVPTASTRVISNIHLAGQGSNAVCGTAVVAAEHVHFDYEPIQEHLAPHGTSSLKAKMLLSGRARAVFQGLVIVDREAQKTNAIQLNKNLVMSKRARIDAMPRLQILPDDVKCKHGSATGEIDTKQVYYMGTRGFSEDEAKRMIMRAFVAEGFAALDPESPLYLLADNALVGSLSSTLKA